jgi:hypothetical protein
MGSAFTDTDFVRQLWAVGLLDKAGGFVPRAPVAKTANYTVVSPLDSAAATPAARVHHARRRRRRHVHAAGDHRPADGRALV